MAGFAQVSDPVDSLRGILSQYPLGTGLCKELLQNSDDAGATEQTFILDCRTHESGQGFASGPAFIAHNNALVTESDWEGLQNMHKSAKTRNAATTGKYGIGFRSCFHLSDTPEILSGRDIAIFDPLKRVLNTTGSKREFIGDHTMFSHLATFSSVFTSHTPHLHPFNATAIRLPLRRIAFHENTFGPAVSSEDVIELLTTFIRNDMSTVLLFCRNLSSIVVRIIAPTEETTTIASVVREQKYAPVRVYNAYLQETSMVLLSRERNVRSDWLRLLCKDNLDHFARKLAEKLGYLGKKHWKDVKGQLEDEKFVPDVGIAFPLNPSTEATGRLFTFLPLPIATNLPFHVNATFALTSDRQSLVNSAEPGAARSAHRFKVEWNRLLFSIAIPAAWCTLLRIGVDRGIRFGDLWPRSAPVDEAQGQQGYWNHTSVHLAELLWHRSIPVWPLVGEGAPVTLSNDTFVTSEAEESYTTALTEVGFKICRLPYHILIILSLATLPLTLLEPEVVRKRLLAHAELLYTAPLTDAGRALRSTILEYLLSSSPVKHIIGLPLIPLKSDEDVYFALEFSDKAQAYLFDDAQAALFGPVLPIYYTVPTLIPDALRDSYLGSKYNLRRLNPKLTVDLTVRALKRLKVEGKGEAVPWAVRLWQWISDDVSDSQRAYVEALAEHPTVPTASGGWSTVAKEGAYFFTDEIRGADIRALLTRGGLPLLHPDVPRAPLESNGFTHSIRDGSSWITKDVLQRAMATAPTESEIQALMELLTDILSTTSSIESEYLGSHLRKLPIFPVISDGVQTTSTERQSIPGDAAVYLIPLALVPPIPKIPNACFVPETLPHAVARSIGAQIAPLTQLDVLRLTLDNFSTQTTTLQAAVVRHMAKEKESILPSTIRRLAECNFVPVAGGNSTARPCAVIDPHSPLCALFPSDDARIPQQSSHIQRKVIKSLSKLGVLISQFSIDIANHCMKRIAGDPTNPAHLSCASSLIEMLDAADVDARLLEVDDSQSWIPCEDGVLRARCDCRDASEDRRHHQDLFDRVLALSRARVTSPTLRLTLNWHRPIPISVLKRQFMLCVNEDGVSTSTLQTLIEELVRRRELEEISVDDMGELRDATTGRRWVPVDGTLRSAADVVFELPVALPPFCRLEASSGAERRFLLEMGCSERPSTQAVLDAYQELLDGTGVGVEVDVQRVISLLKTICLDPLSDAQLAQLAIPAEDNCMYPRERVYHNDMPPQDETPRLPESAHLAHEQIDVELARLLRLAPLSRLYIRELYDEEDMGEPLASRVSNVLVQYQREQMPTEFVANAIDSGATSVAFTIDEVDFSTSVEHLLHPGLKDFQSGGSLVVYNNSKFTGEDWIGIKRVGQGSKRGAAGTIGKFGLGALAAYHISEVTMVISGDYFLVLDPSRRYLRNGRASRQIKLEDMHRFYQDQLRPFFGHHGFEEGDTFYDGTLFRLPLRTLAQAARSELCKSSFSTTDSQLLLDRYSESGKLAALFVQALYSLRVLRRSTSANGTQSSTPALLWSLVVDRSDTTVKTLTPRTIQAACVRLRVISPAEETTEEWETYSQSLRLSPADQRLADRYRLSDTISVGVALRSDMRETAVSRLFSHLPLPISTSLPFQVHASFIMAEDRRAIRLDETALEDSESTFNQRLLSTHVPALYLEALHRLSPTRSLLDENLLPDKDAISDAPSRLVASGLYSTFAEDDRLLCQSVTGDRITPSSAVFADETIPEGVRRALELLAPRNYVLGPTALKFTAVPRVCAGFVRDTIASSTQVFQDLFVSKRVTLAMVASLLQYLVDDDAQGKHLVGLPLLPVADGSLTTFNSESPAVFTLPLPLRTALVGQAAPWHVVFPPDRFLHPAIPSSLQDSLLSANGQIRLFDDIAIAQLVRARLPVSPKSPLSAEDAAWVLAFWELYPTIHPSDIIDENLFDMPLVPVRGTGWNAVSLASCNSADVFFKSANSPSSAIEALYRMGASIVDKPGLPHILKMHERIQASTFSLHAVLEFLNLGARERFNLLLEPQRAEFRQWLTTQLCRLTTLSQQDVAIARTLPLVPIRDSADYGTPDEIVMLPDFIDLADVLPLTDASYRLADYDEGIVRAFKIDTVDPWELCKEIALQQEIGQTISGSALTGLRGFLASVLDTSRVTSHDLSPLKLPNAHGVYVAQEDLFSRMIPLFVEILAVPGRRPEAFVHPDLSGLEGHMRKLAVQTELDSESFGKCVQAVHDATDVLQVESGHSAYNFYRNELFKVRRVAWTFFDDRCFIPRELDRRRLRPDFDGYATNLPPVVAPSQILLEKYEDIAWSQRARVAEPPTGPLLHVRPELGIPTFEDVIAHIHVLYRIGQDMPYDLDVEKDAQASYEYLEANLDRLPGEIIHTLRTTDVFLNTDGRDTVWQWCSPAVLIFNAPDDGQEYRRVRRSLAPYTKLLLHLGAMNIAPAETPSIQRARPVDALRMLRESFNQKRQEEIAIDVVFVDVDGGRHPAHRIFLAGCAAWFDFAFFKSNMRETTTDGGPHEMSLQYCGDAVERCLDYFYTGEYEKVEHRDLQVLFDMLAIVDYWDIDDFRTTIELDLSTHLSPTVYEEIYDYAKKYHGDKLVKICEEWEKTNQTALKRVGLARVEPESYGSIS
ncbi:unnamed protein product [Peniophora sp. CBMAI 1063]|nr:unnamed protein product [Peniophora sp. CBMAI 1063]